MKFNFYIILFLVFLISVRGQKYLPPTKSLPETTYIAIPTTSSSKTVSTTTTKKTLSTPPVHYSDNIQNCPVKYYETDNCNDACEIYYLNYYRRDISKVKIDTNQDLESKNDAFTYCAVHEKYDEDKMECVEIEILKRFYEHYCSLKGATYNPNLSACILSTPYNETEGCNNSDQCGQAWIVENDKHEKICQTKHKVNNILFRNIPVKTDALNYHKNCSNECLVNYFTTNSGNSFEIIDGYYEECYCTPTEPARLCNDECTITYTNKDIRYDYQQNEDYKWNETSSIEYSIQRSGDDAEWCKCPSPTELKYISKAEKPECCIGDECLDSSLPKCCSESKAFIHLNHVYYGVENDEYCIWPAEKKIPELVTKPAKALPRTSVHWHPDGGTKQITTKVEVSPSITTTTKMVPLSIITEVVSTPFTEYVTMSTSVPQKKVVKITKKVTAKVTKKVTVKVTKKKNSSQ